MAWLAPAPSLQVKWRFLSVGGWHFAAEVGYFRLDTSRFQRTANEDDAVFTLGTGLLTQSVELGSRHQLSNGLVATGVRAVGTVTDDNLETALDGAVTNLQYVGAYEDRFSRTLALVVTGRYQFFTVASGDFVSTATADDFTTIEIAAEGDDDTVLNFENAFSIVPSLNWSWDHFNLRLGVGYGNYNLPGVNFMLKDRTVIPELNLFWTF